MSRFPTTDGRELRPEDDREFLRIAHVLQRFRDVWVVESRHPFFTIDAPRVEAHAKGLTEFAVFTEDLLYQNISRAEIGALIVSFMVGSGTSAGPSATADIVVEGRANRQAHGLVRFNPYLLVGTFPYCALGERFIYVDPDDVYQHSLGDLVTMAGQSRPRSSLIAMDRLADLRDEIWRTYFADGGRGRHDVTRLESLLDAAFTENERILEEASAYHYSFAPHAATYDYRAPVLTRYARLTHDPVTRQPLAEVSYALLHYEHALHELASLKDAAKAGNNEEAFRHGVACTVAAAATVESIANRLVFLATGRHPDWRDRRQPLPKINESCALLATRDGKTYQPLVVGMPTYDELEELRVLRNRFMHAVEDAQTIDTATSLPSVLAAVTEDKCRQRLQHVRLAAEWVFGQLPAIPAPIVINRRVTWLGNLEVP